MKDSGAVYDILIRADLNRAAIAKAT